MPDFPIEDYQRYGLASFRKAVRGLWEAADEVDTALERMQKYGLQQLIADEREFYAALRELRIAGTQGNGLSSGLSDGLFLIRDFAHKLSLLIPGSPGEEGKREPDHPVRGQQG